MELIIGVIVLIVLFKITGPLLNMLGSILRSAVPIILGLFAFAAFQSGSVETGILCIIGALWLFKSSKSNGSANSHSSRSNRRRDSSNGRDLDSIERMNRRQASLDAEREARYRQEQYRQEQEALRIRREERGW